MEKIVPPIKKVGTSDGAKMGSSYTTITTPNPKEDKIGWRTSDETGSIMGKK